MYNRYIPQPDGSYRRKRLEEPAPARTISPPEEPVPFKAAPEVNPPHCPPPQSQAEVCSPPSCPRQNGIGFLRQLLPKDCDTGDLIVIALLLLIAGDCEAERSNALLTLALYFCM